MTVAFFDVLAFFGAVSFLAWITFAPLQRDQLEKFVRQSHIARDNFSSVNDYFLGSFLGFAISAGFDYVYHYVEFHPAYKGYSPILYDAIGFGFFTGMAALLWAILYIRLIVKGEKDWDDINPPVLLYTVAISGYVVALTYWAALGVAGSSSSLEGGAYLASILLTAWAGWQAIRYHEELRIKRRAKHRATIGLAVLVFTTLALQDVITPVFRWIQANNFTNDVLIFFGILLFVFVAYRIAPRGPNSFPTVPTSLAG